MLSFLEYMLKVSACYAAAWLFYSLLLSRLTSYKTNRVYLLLSSVLAFVLPLIQLDTFIQPQTINSSQLINSIPALHIADAAGEYIPAESALNASIFFSGVFVAGLLVCFARFVMQLHSFKKITGTARFINVFFGVKLYHLDADILPFSFGSSVYVNPGKHSANELQDIIKHESVHVHQQHTMDVLLTEITCMANWYNPFAWLMKKAIKQNLEFLADDAVLNEGADKKSYQYLLLKVTGYSPLNIASGFTLSSLKQRIYMMNKNKTSQRHLVKLLLVLPLIACMMAAFRNPNATGLNAVVTVKEENFMLTELSYNIPDIKIDGLVKQEASKSLLQVGKPFSISIIKNERDRLRTLLEKNGYTNISSNAISFLIDSTLSNNRFAIQVNIDLERRESSYRNQDKQLNELTTAAQALQTTQQADRVSIAGRQQG